MSPQPALKSASESLGQTLALVQVLLEKQKLVTTLVHRPGGPCCGRAENDMVTVRAAASPEVIRRYLRRPAVWEPAAAGLNGLPEASPGSSALLAPAADGMGDFIYLGLAAVPLAH